MTILMAAVWIMKDKTGDLKIFRYNPVKIGTVFYNLHSDILAEPNIFQLQEYSSIRI